MVQKITSVLEAVNNIREDSIGSKSFVKLSAEDF
jgi:hypothetical protein